MKHYGFYVNGQYTQSSSYREITSPLSGEILAVAASLEEKNEAVEAALSGAYETHQQILRGFFPLSERLDFLKRFRERLQLNSEALIHNLVHEIGKPVTLAQLEVQRALSTLDWTRVEALQFLKPQGLATASLSTTPSGYFEPLPRGPLLAITPFNFPLNLALHKLAPAWALGCPVVLKPSPKAILMALSLADAAHAAGLPPGLLSVLPASNELTQEICKDPRISQISFTGSENVGWKLFADSQKPVFLELGGHAPVFVDESAKVKESAEKILRGAFSFAGQVCISIQNIFVHEKIAEDFKKELISGLQKFPWGDARNAQVLSSVVIDDSAQERLERESKDLLQGGARNISGPLHSFDNFQSPRLLRPQIFENVPGNSSLMQREIFAPWASLQTLPNLESYLETVNAFSGRLQTSVFTQDLQSSQRALRELYYGGVFINESPSFRMEAMPYGGMGTSGLGREGPRFAMEAFSEIRSCLIQP